MCICMYICVYIKRVGLIKARPRSDPDPDPDPDYIDSTRTSLKWRER